MKYVRFFTLLLLAVQVLLYTGCGGTFPDDIQPLKEEVPRFVSGFDRDSDGVDDLQDIVEGARVYIKGGVIYKDGYYAGGYPPEGEGVCTDVIWVALQEAGFDLKAMVDKDIQEYTAAYPRVNGRPEPNIDFRRVKNLKVFFEKYAEILTTEVKPGDLENLAEWQGGDVVIFGPPLEHIAVVSDRRRPDGVPLLLHNGGPEASEADVLLRWQSEITGHYRFPKAQ